MPDPINAPDLLGVEWDATDALRPAGADGSSTCGDEVIEAETLALDVVYCAADDVVGFGPAEDLTRDVGQGAVHPVTFGPGLDPALLGVGEDDVVGAVTVAHRCPLCMEGVDLTDTLGVPARCR